MNRRWIQLALTALILMAAVLVWTGINSTMMNWLTWQTGPSSTALLTWKLVPAMQIASTIILVAALWFTWRPAK